MTSHQASQSKPARSAPQRRGSIRGRQGLAGWLFIAPIILILGLFLVIPVLMAAWVSVSDWTGRGSPFSGSVNFVGTENYSTILGGEGLIGRDFGTSIRNNFYYVVLVVPLQTALSLFLAVMVNRQILKGRGFFRTAFYFPSVTSSVAITVLWLFLFSATGVVNKVLSFFAIEGPNWFQDPRGVLHILLGVVGLDQAPDALQDPAFLGISGWEWLAGPSVAMTAFVLMAIFTTSGTFMLLFIAALQNVSGEVQEAAMMDGATGWQRFRRVTLPMLRPTLFTVLTLGLIGTWQVFDQIYTGTQGGPAKTTLTPAYLSFNSAFVDQQWGVGAAIAFVLFAIIVVLTLVQRWALRERDVPRRRRMVPAGVSGGSSAAAAPGIAAPKDEKRDTH
ncbi:multiple sugar transport system permease protein [Arthrobacter pigmenti]|uniref:Multiple sugar transport system permease protein n=1 Tax=Arthrobacter pigmenti TaxID=271432 RepID=A0A846RPP8_9MICC|nr:sugar ABC transporter permease [Arthrobacter pigmenti]NJC23550.1 multiple sugar transport system permease protein [Arthrobacter pigmenti]